MATWRVAFAKAFGFHVAWERRLNPSLEGQAVAVIRGGRVFDLAPELLVKGIGLGARRNHLLDLCPEVHLVPYEPERYEEGQRRLLDVFARRLPAVEPVEVAEAFLDVAGLGGTGTLLELCRRLGREVLAEIGMTVGLGLGPTKLVARAAGLQLGRKGLPQPGDVLAVSEVQTFLDPLPVAYLYPFPPEIPARLERLGFRSIGEVRSLPTAELARQFGWPLARRLAAAVAGGNGEPVRSAWPPPSIRTTLRFEGGLGDRVALERVLGETAGRFAREMADQGLACGEIGLAFRSDGGREVEASRRLIRPGRSLEALGFALLGLAERLLADWPETDPPVEAEARAGRILPRAARQLDLENLLGWGVGPGPRDEVKEVVKELAWRFGRGVIQGGPVRDSGASRHRRRENLLGFYDPLRGGAGVGAGGGAGVGGGGHV